MVMLVVDGVKYKLWTPKDEEKEFHPMIKEHSKEIFGEDSIYFDVKHVLKTTSGIGSIPDAYVINLPKQELYVVENELATHPVYDHIVKQLTKFINGVENQDARSQIIDMLYEEINRDLVLRAIVQKKIGSNDIYHFLSKLFSKHPRIVIIIDEKTSEVEEACRVLKYQTDIIEFKTFVREGADSGRAHLFEPLYALGKVVDASKASEAAKKAWVTIRAHSWEKMLATANDELKRVTRELEQRIVGLSDVKLRMMKNKTFYRGKMANETCFVSLQITERELIVRIRANPTTFKDPKKWSIDGIRKGFFKQQSKFKITSLDQIDYAMELIKQSYDISGEPKKSRGLADL